MEALTIIGGLAAFAAVLNGVLGVLSAFRQLDKSRAEQASGGRYQARSAG